MLRIGSLFSGYGGLCDLAVAPYLGGRVVWHSEIDPAASKVLAHHWPSTPNLGDITKIGWGTVEPVDVLTGGFPCQDVSMAGKRAGLRPDTRSGLWAQFAHAIDQLRPSLVIIENVRGILSAEAHCDMEPCPLCVGDGRGGSVLRALGAVLGDLADLGFDAEWCGVRAADAGAPHARFRVFVAAYPTLDGRPRSGSTRTGRTGPSDDDRAIADGLEGVGRQLAGARDADGCGGSRRAWGQYEPAIRRWEHLTGRAAPAPTVAGRRGGRVLNPEFSEWMMGLPHGHITSVPGLSRNDQLRLAGNGVCPQQARLALGWLLPGVVSVAA